MDPSDVAGSSTSGKFSNFDNAERKSQEKANAGGSEFSNRDPFAFSNDIRVRNRLTRKYDEVHYDPQELRPKNVICSEIISKRRLTARDANLKDPLGASTAELDENFLENLKKRMYDDRERTGTFETNSVGPKRSTVRKRRALLNKETLNLIKKFREEMCERSDRFFDDGLTHGIFTMNNNDGSENRENIHATKETNVDIGNSEIKSLTTILAETPTNEITSDTDQSSFCPTPMLIFNEFEQHRSPSSALREIDENINQHHDKF